MEHQHVDVVIIGAGLTGIYQALSFMGLGVVLLAIGWLYQRLLFPRRPPAAYSAGAGSG